jgi:5-carboxymethyl-2-hydroxymuconate isomerase
MATGRDFSMSGINSGHHNLPTYEMAMKLDNVEFVWYCGGTGLHFQNGRHNTAKIQHCSISKVAFN